MASQQLQQYASVAWEPSSLIELRPLPLTCGKREWILAKDLPAKASDLTEQNRQGANLFAGILPRNRHGGGSGKDVDGGHVIWVDLDNCDEAAAMTAWSESALPRPSMAISTGHGVHLFWRLNSWTPKDAIQAAIQGLIARFAKTSVKADECAKDAARILRLPGFINHKPPVAESKVIYAEREVTYSISDFPAIPQADSPLILPPSFTSYGDGDLTHRARQYISTIPGSAIGGRNKACFRVAALLQNDFALPSQAAWQLIVEWNAANNSPPLDEKELSEAFNSGKVYAKRDNGRLLATSPPQNGNVNHDIDLSPLESQSKAVLLPKDTTQNHIVIVNDDEYDGDELLAKTNQKLDPLPINLLDAPGLIHDTMEWGINATKYPNRPLIFAAVLSTFATLVSRKIIGEGNIYPNIYTLAVATSGAGKDAGNDIAASLLNKIGMDKSIQYELGSAEAIEDAFCDMSPVILWLNDEIDTWLSGAKSESSRGSGADKIIRRLLSLFNSSSKILYRRTKARNNGRKLNETPRESIIYPHMSMYGTCTPGGFFSAFNERMAGGGLLGRLLIFDGNQRGCRQRTTADLENPPESVLNIAKYWAGHVNSRGNLAGVIPDPMIVPITEKAKTKDDEWAAYVDQQVYPEYERKIDNTSCSIWARTAQYAMKLALLYAASENHIKPVIDVDAVNWGWEIASRQSKRLITLYNQNSAETPFQSQCLKILNRLRQNEYNPLLRTDLLRMLRVKSAEFDTIIQTLIERSDILEVAVKTKTNTAIGYRLK